MRMSSRYKSRLPRWFMSATLFPAVVFFVVSCTPSRDYLLKKSAEVGLDKDYVRVLILKTTDRVLVGAGGKMRIMDIRNRDIKYEGKGRQVYFYPDRISKPVVVESWDAPVTVNGKGYRGIIEMHSILGKIHVINEVKMEYYLYGVIPNEIPSSWNIEALKAQAIAARTYAYYHIMTKKESLYDLESTGFSQVYQGISAEKKTTCRAVDETAGLIAVYRNRPILAFFHSTCGGHTIDDRYVWKGTDQPYLTLTRCGYCKKSPHFSWEEHISLYDIKHHLGRKYHGVGNITGISFRKNQDRISEVEITHENGITRLSGNDFRLIFPDKKIKSLYFDACKTGNGLHLKGHGWGHGVGMCQWGAKGMAEKGAKFNDILKFYYRDVSLIRIGRPVASEGPQGKGVLSRR